MLSSLILLSRLTSFMMSIKDTQVELGNGKTELPEIETWDTYYDNPDAKVILVSSDKVGFRVDAHYLKRKSGFIKDMIEIPSAQPLELSPIILDYNSKVVRLFIEFALAQSPPLVQVVMEDFQGLFEMCDQFQAEDVAMTTTLALKAVVEQRSLPEELDPWAVFKLAADRDDIELARAAIFALESECYFSTFGTKPASFFDDIPIRYASALLLAACQAFQEHREEEDLDKHGWRCVSEKFVIR